MILLLLRQQGMRAMDMLNKLLEHHLARRLQARQRRLNLIAKAQNRANAILRRLSSGRIRRRLSFSASARRAFGSWLRLL